MPWVTKTSDNFNRADESPIQTPWISPANTDKVDIFNNSIVRNVSRTDSGLCRAFLSNSLSYNQRQASIVQVALVANLGIRAQDVDNCYYLYHSENAAFVFLSRMESGNRTTLASTSTSDINSTGTHYWFFGIDGSFMKGTGIPETRSSIDTIDSLAISNFLTASDATFGSGKAQIMGNSRTSTQPVDNWEGLEFGDITLRVFPKSRGLNLGGFPGFSKGRLVNTGGF
jgi:hypothetical protein